MGISGHADFFIGGPSAIGAADGLTSFTSLFRYANFNQQKFYFQSRPVIYSFPINLPPVGHPCSLSLSNSTSGANFANSRPILLAAVLSRAMPQQQAAVFWRPTRRGGVYSSVTLVVLAFRPGSPPPTLAPGGDRRRSCHRREWRGVRDGA